MYCSSCGKDVIQGVSYCNQCGARVSSANERDTTRLSESSFNTLLAGVMGIPIAGLGIIIGLMSVMKKELGFSKTLIVTFTCLSFLLLLIAEAIFVWLLWSHRRTVHATDDKDQLKVAQTKELGEAPAREFAEPVVSVTENTTRTFEPVYNKRKTK